MKNAPTHPPQPKRAQRSQAAARKRGKQDAEHQMYRQKVMQQWQRASMLLAVSLFTMMATVPFVVLVIVGSLGVKLGIPQRYAALWLVVLLVPPSTVPAAAAYAYLRREELQDDVFAEGEPPRRHRWGW